jgi:hypothetical protein
MPSKQRLGVNLSHAALREFTWVRAIHRYWLLPAEMVGIGLLILGFLAGVVLSLLGGREIVAVAVGCLWGASFLVTMLHHVAFFSLIRCPACGYNPTRTLAGKKLAVKTALTRLARYEHCPRCGNGVLASDS